MRCGKRCQSNDKLKDTKEGRKRKHQEDNEEASCVQARGCPHAGFTHVSLGLSLRSANHTDPLDHGSFLWALQLRFSCLCRGTGVNGALPDSGSCAQTP